MPPSPALQALAPIRGDMAAQVRAFAWEATSIGPLEQWPAALRITVATMLECQLPMYLAWGEDFVQIFNDAYVPILGAKGVSALGARAPDTWAEIWPQIGPMWQRALGGEPVGFDDFKLTIDRFGYPEDVYFNFSYSAVRDEQGQARGLLVTFAETTEKVLTSRRLAFLDGLAQATRGMTDPAAVMRTTAERLGRHLGVNRCAYATVREDEDTFDLIGDFNDGVPSIIGTYRFSDFGATVLQLMRADLAYVNHDVDRDPATAGVDLTAYRRTRIQSVICVPLHKDGRFVAGMAVHQSVARHWTDDEIALVKTVVARCWEALERTRAEAAQREAMHERTQLLESERTARLAAEQAGLVKDEFLATLSHELRTPLSAITGWVHILRRKFGGRDADLTKAIDVIDRSAKAQTQLIEDLLDMSRITSGQLALEVAPVSPASFTLAAVELLAPAAERAGVALTIDVAPDEDATVMGDAARLQQVVANLVSNAIKFTPRGGHVQVSLRCEDGTAEIAVADSGIGIAPAFLPFVFDRFRQADGSMARRYGGLGLGLSIVRNLVELHGGQVRAHSDGEGRGARFSVSLSLIAARNAACPLPEMGAVDRTSLAGVRVLVVDDDEAAREMVTRALELQGAQVLPAASGAEALALLPGSRADLLISDLGMPGMTGFELLARIRALPPEQGGSIHAIALTAFAREADRHRALAAGFQHHFRKPVEFSALVRAIQAVARA